MDLTAFEHAVRTLRVDRANDRPAPNKALVLLTALTKLQRLGSSSLRYEEAEEPVGDALECLGRDRNVRDPFWRLEETLWVPDRVPEDQRPRGKMYPAKKVAGEYGGHLTPAVEDLFTRDPEALRHAIQTVLDLHIAPSSRGVVREILGIDEVKGGRTEIAAREQEWVGLSPAAFRSAVLEAYDFTCAVCGCGLGLKGKCGVGLEAAHIRWRSREGVNEVTNGFAMCAVHHRLYDLGIFSVLPGDLKVEVSPRVSGRSGQGYHEWLERFDAARKPTRSRDAPLDDYLSWHREVIFEGERRTSIRG